MDLVFENMSCFCLKLGVMSRVEAVTLKDVVFFPTCSRVFFGFLTTIHLLLCCF